MIQHTLKLRPFFFLLIIPLLTGILYPAILFADAESDMKKNPPPPVKGQVLFEDLFQDNKNKWLTEENPLFRIYIENGKYILEQKLDGNERVAVNNQFNLPDDVNFKIEALIEKIQVSDNYGYGLIWGSSDINYQYRFYVSDNGNYSIKKREKGKDSDIIPWKKYREIDKQNSQNKLTIVRYGCFTYFYVNDEYLDEVPNLSLYGKKVGFVIEGKQKISVTSIHITKLEAEEAYADKKCPETEPVSTEEKSPEAEEKQSPEKIEKPTEEK